MTASYNLSQLGSNYLQGGTGSVARTTASKLQESVSVLDFGADPTGVSDSTTAIQNAVNVGGTVYFPAGTYKITAPIVRSASGLVIQGAGIGVATIIAGSGFSGSAMLTLGLKSTTGQCQQISVKDISLNCNLLAACGMEIYGVQDGSSFERIYISQIVTAGIITGWSNSANAAPSFMNEGLIFNNVQCLGRNDSGTISGGSYFKLSGLYESTFINCKALGYTSATHTNCYGFNIGAVVSLNLSNPDCQAVRLINCSSGNFSGSGNIGVFFGNTFHSSADAHTMETIQGKAFVFGQASGSGTASDKYSASYCTADKPRFYNPALDTTIFTTFFEFNNAAYACSGKGIPNLNPLSGQYMATFNNTADVCLVECLSCNAASSGLSTYVTFGTSGVNNLFRIFTGNTTYKNQTTYAKSQYYAEYFPDGTQIQHTQFYTQYLLATDMRICKSDATQVFTVTATGAVILNKTLLPTSAVGSTGQIWYDTTASNTLKII